MATTAVVAEILIIGLEVEAWMFLAAVAIFGTDWLDAADSTNFAGLLVIVVLSLAYVLGILVDRLADTLVDWFERTRRGKRIKRRLLKNRKFKTPERVSKMRLTVMYKSDGIARFLDYQRSRWRITRATVINLAFGGVAGVLYLALNAAWYWLFAPLAGALVLIPTTYFAGVRIQEAWVKRLSDAYRIVGNQSAEVTHSRREPPQVVAAVCHRHGPDGIELVVVRTKGGKRWTFPKGHVEPDELPHEAAAREAREEAGVEGDVTSVPFTRYRYAATRDDEGETLVSAYLLTVRGQGSPGRKESTREPKWVGPDEAVRLLASCGREPEYAEEHARVVREAVAALAPDG